MVTSSRRRRKWLHLSRELTLLAYPANAEKKQKKIWCSDSAFQISHWAGHACLVQSCCSQVRVNLHRQVYMLPHWKWSCTSNLLSHPVTGWHQANQPKCCPSSPGAWQDSHLRVNWWLDVEKAPRGKQGWNTGLPLSRPPDHRRSV